MRPLIFIEIFLTLGRVEVLKVVPAEREIPANTTVAFSVSFWPVSRNDIPPALILSLL